MELLDSIIIGGGPAGLTAGIYLARAKNSVLILDKSMPGGQMILTHEVANYPGHESISGYMLSMQMKKQAENFGAKILSNIQISKLNLDQKIKSVSLSDGRTFKAKSIILSPGGRSRKLNIPGEDTFTGRGISYCATCDGDFFQDKEIIVVGGGNSALEEADSLTKYAKKVTIIHMLDQWQAFGSAIKTMEENPKIDSIMESRIVEFHGEESLQYVTIEHIPTKTKRKMPIDGCFVFIGYSPNTEELQDLIQLNKNMEIIVDQNLMTSKEGVFAAGDAIAKKYRQITTAVSDGTIAAMSSMEYLNDWHE